MKGWRTSRRTPTPNAEGGVRRGGPDTGTCRFGIMRRSRAALRRAGREADEGSAPARQDKKEILLPGGSAWYNVLCVAGRSVGIGRQWGLKIPWAVRPVRVQIPPPAPWFVALPSHLAKGPVAARPDRRLRGAPESDPDRLGACSSKSC